MQNIEPFKRAVVTGGCGFIGSYVVQELIKNKYTVIVIDNLSQGKKESLPNEVTLITADIRNYKEVENVVEENDIIFHLAALTSVPLSIENPLPYHETNIAGTYNILEAARVKKASGIIFSSSAAVYGNQEGVMTENTPPSPESPYASQKYIGEQLCNLYSRLHGIPAVCLRYFNVYGKGNHEQGSYAPVTARFLKARREGTPLFVTGDGEQTRDFIHVEDVAKANISAVSLLTKKPFEIINVCSGISSKIIKIAKQIDTNNIQFLPARNEIKDSLGDATKFHMLIPKEETISFEDGLKNLL